MSLQRVGGSWSDTNAQTRYDEHLDLLRCLQYFCTRIIREPTKPIPLKYIQRLQHSGYARSTPLSTRHSDEAFATKLIVYVHENIGKIVPEGEHPYSATTELKRAFVTLLSEWHNRALEDKMAGKLPYTKKHEFAIWKCLREIDRLGRLDVKLAAHFDQLTRPEWPFRFLDLPYDIRHQIYTDLLLSQEGYLEVFDLGDLASGRAFRRGREQRIFSSPPDSSIKLLLTSHAIHDETAPVLYGNNTFILKSIDAIHPSPGTLPLAMWWLYTLPDKYRVLLRKIEVVIQAPSPRHEFPFQYPLLTGHGQWGHGTSLLPDIGSLLPNLQSLLFVTGSMGGTDIKDDRIKQAVRAHAEGGFKAENIYWDFDGLNARLEKAARKALSGWEVEEGKSVGPVPSSDPTYVPPTSPTLLSSISSSESD